MIRLNHLILSLLFNLLLIASYPLILWTSWLEFPISESSMETLPQDGAILLTPIEISLLRPVELDEKGLHVTNNNSYSIGYETYMIQTLNETYKELVQTDSAKTEAWIKNGCTGLPANSTVMDPYLELTCDLMKRISGSFIVYMAIKALVMLMGLYAVCVLFVLFLKQLPNQEQAMLKQVLAIERLSFIMSVLALFQWVFVTPAIMSPDALRSGPFLDLGLIFILFMEHEHLSYWIKEIEYFALEAKYMGLSFS